MARSLLRFNLYWSESLMFREPHESEMADAMIEAGESWIA
jgi:hypothetical protein